MRSGFEKVARAILWLPVAVGLALILGGGWLYWHFRGSLARLDGTVAVSSARLSAEVQIDRDALGVPTIRAENREDAAFAMGWLHAQDRFFQMDLNRRVGAGEVSAVFGAMAVDYDKRLRFFAGRGMARTALAALSSERRAVMEAYAEGVNAGLADLRKTPPEYLRPGVSPEPWKAEDCFLVALSMYYSLQDSLGRLDEDRALLASRLPEEVTEFLFSTGSRWEAPILGEPRAVLPIPVEAWAAALAEAEDNPGSAASVPTQRPLPGSNAWASNRSGDGRALLANDMHLGLHVPNTWYRAGMRLADGHRFDGVTLPGLPLFLAGSNGRIAWGFTNSYIDTTDLVRLEVHPDDPNRYRTPEGWEVFGERVETISVLGREPTRLKVRETRWGPVRPGREGALYAVVWVGVQSWAWNLEMLALERAATLDEALSIAPKVGLPTQNGLFADAEGNFAWILTGPIPDRAGMDGFFPMSIDEWGMGWRGRAEPEAYPVVRNSAEGALWSGNQAKVTTGPMAAFLGNGGPDEGQRASRIRDRLLAEGASEEQFLDLQKDVALPSLEGWRQLFVAHLERTAMATDATADATAPQRARLLAILREWDGAASADSVGYPVLRALREWVLQRGQDHLLSPLGKDRADLRLAADLPLDRVVLEAAQTPLDSLSPNLAGWEAFIEQAVSGLIGEAGERLGTVTWGAHNRLAMEHPLARAVPPLKRVLNMPPTPMGGDRDTVRVQGDDFGASMRMVVSPGREAEGFFHQPGGASGHFLSPFYRAGHAAWVRAEPTPFLPGEPLHTLILRPAEGE